MTERAPTPFKMGPKAKRRPLNVRLRDEASQWDAYEPIIALLLEAAEAVELLACEVAIQKATHA